MDCYDYFSASANFSAASLPPVRPPQENALTLAVAVVLTDGLLQLGVGGV